jgi:hypothetical protein
VSLYAVYDPSTGEILRVGNCTPDDLAVIDAKVAESGHAAIERYDESHNDATAYVLDGVVTIRPAMGATIDGLTLSDIPIGAVLTIEGVEYTITDGEAELSFSAAGTYTVTLSHWPHYDQSFEVVAT